MEVDPTRLAVALQHCLNGAHELVRRGNVHEKLRSWLCWPGGGNLALPDDPEIEYVDAMLVGAGNWSDLFEAGRCELA